MCVPLSLQVEQPTFDQVRSNLETGSTDSNGQPSLELASSHHGLETTSDDVAAPPTAVFIGGSNNESDGTPVRRLQRVVYTLYRVNKLCD